MYRVPRSQRERERERESKIMKKNGEKSTDDDGVAIVGGVGSSSRSSMTKCVICLNSVNTRKVFAVRFYVCDKNPI